MGFSPDVLLDNTVSLPTVGFSPDVLLDNTVTLPTVGFSPDVLLDDTCLLCPQWGVVVVALFVVTLENS